THAVCYLLLFIIMWCSSSTTLFPYTTLFRSKSTSDTIPYNEIYNDNISLEHEAKVSKVSEEQLFYLMSRGLEEQEATDMIVMGFIEPFTRELPMEYAVEMNRLISMEMEG